MVIRPPCAEAGYKYRAGLGAAIHVERPRPSRDRAATHVERPVGFRYKGCKRPSVGSRRNQRLSVGVGRQLEPSEMRLGRYGTGDKVR